MGNLPSQLRTAAADGDVAKIIAICNQSPTIINNASDQDGWTPLHYAALKNHAAAIKELLDLGASVDQQTKDGSTPLHVAALRGHSAVVQQLLQRGAAVDTRDGQTAGRMTALHKAAAAGFADVCKQLLEAGADVNGRSLTGAIPGHLAAARGKLQALETLLMAGMEVDCQDLDLRTALHDAAEGGHLQCALLLLAHGAHVQAKDKDGRTPGQLALINKHGDVVRMIEPTAQLPQPLSPAEEVGRAQGPAGRSVDWVPAPVPTSESYAGQLAVESLQQQAQRPLPQAATVSGVVGGGYIPPPPRPGSADGYPAFPGQLGFMQGPVGLGEQYAYPALVSGTNIRYAPPSAPPLEPSVATVPPSAPSSTVTGATRPASAGAGSSITMSQLFGAHATQLEEQRYAGPAAVQSPDGPGTRVQILPPPSTSSHSVPPSIASLDPHGGAAGSAAAAGGSAVSAHTGAGDADWANVADGEGDNEGGWGLGPQEAAALAREEAERRARRKGAGHVIGEAARRVWGLVQGAAHAAAGHADRHSDDDDFDDDEYDEAGANTAKNSGRAEARRQAPAVASAEETAFAAERMAALEAEISRRNGWIRGAELAAPPMGRPAPSATPSEALRVYQQQMEIQFLRQQLESLQLQQQRQQSSVSSAQLYTYQELYTATGGFAASACIGTGGFGRVYRGVLHHTPVAVKVLNPNAVQGAIQFKAEVDILSRVRHPHIVLLLGCCPESHCLVYELLDNGSLEDYLRNDDKATSLTWAHRVKILLDTASALLALHTLRPDPILHRDVKPANVLLDASLSAKLADVGLARIAPELAPAAGIAGSGVSTVMDSSPMGTLLYTDPVYLQSGQYGAKSDVYSLGMTMLQTVMGKVDPVLQQAEQAMSAKRVLAMVDKRMRDKPNEQEAEALVSVALRCCSYARAQRPDLEKEVLPALTQLYQSAMAVLFAAQGAKGRAGASNEPPTMFVCPITQEVMQWPVVCADGYTYEKSAINRWLERHNTSPLTNAVLAHKQLTPNHVLRSAILDWRQEHPDL